jgi:hypothetical protein
MTNLVKEATEMGGFSFWHWIVVLFLFFVVGFPVAKILGRLGLSKVFVILAFIPLVNWIALWVLAYAKWPAIPNDAETFK